MGDKDKKYILNTNNEKERSNFIYELIILLSLWKIKMMAQRTYDNESVLEILAWANKKLETQNYPTEKFQINECTTILNGKTYLESLISMISRNWENPTFHPTIEHLWEYKEIWENREAK